MKNVTILIDVAIPDSALASLRELEGCRIEYVAKPEERVRELDPELIREVDILFCTFPPANHTVMRNLKWIQIASTGYTQLYGLDLVSRGVRATNARGCFDVPIGEWVMAMMVNLARDLRQMIRNQDAADWDRSAIFQNEIHGRTVGIWGYGGIGRETARLARHFGLRVHVMTRAGIGPRREVFTEVGTGDREGVLPDRVFRAGQELEFLRELDFLVMALPLTKVTEGLIGERELQALPPRAFVLNPARGPIIRQDALLRALREKWIAGAALDTHYHYPMPPGHQLWGFPNVILTPHIAGSSLSPKFGQRLGQILTLNVKRFLQGEPLLNELAPAQLSET